MKIINDTCKVTHTSKEGNERELKDRRLAFTITRFTPPTLWIDKQRNMRGEYTAIFFNSRESARVFLTNALSALDEIEAAEAFFNGAVK